MRLRHNKNALQLINDSNYSIKNFPFHIEKNTTLEIGMGKGKMLSEMAINDPEGFKKLVELVR